jgi:hypothetical protein
LRRAPKLYKDRRPGHNPPNTTRFAMSEKVQPHPEADAFTCPHCTCYAYQTREIMHVDVAETTSYEEWSEFTFNEKDVMVEGFLIGVNASRIITTTCAKCEKPTIWIENYFESADDEDYIETYEMIYPKTFSIFDPPNEDLDEEIKTVYKQAAAIVQESPIASCALLRLCMEKIIIKHANYKGNQNILKNIIDELKDIGTIDENIYKAMQSIRIVGNNAIHNGSIKIDDLDENLDMAVLISRYINLMATELITRKKEINSVFEAAQAFEAKKKAAADAARAAAKQAKKDQSNDAS